MLFQNAQKYNKKGYHVHDQYHEEKIHQSFKTVSEVVSLVFLVSGLSHTVPFCSMFCLTDFEEWETVHSLPLFKRQTIVTQAEVMKKNTKGKATILRKG